MIITGELLIGASQIATAETFVAVYPATGLPLAPTFSAAGRTQIDAACQLAADAFDSFRELDKAARARFLETCAERIVALGDRLLARAHEETVLPLARLAGERDRTVTHLRLFADEVRQGHWMGVRIDSPLPHRTPAPRPEMRQRMVPLGPVAVFGASNFPLAFSVAGGDTAAAFAAGCPVVVKNHRSHAGTGELVARAIRGAVASCGLHDGVFSLLNGASHAVGEALVADPRIKAVAFTGSRGGGQALLQIAQDRAEPIPVYAEMSSINPVLVLPGALATRGAALGKEYVASLTLGCGQFCTNPGLCLVFESAGAEDFSTAAAAALAGTAAGIMLNNTIHAAYEAGVAAVEAVPQVATLARGMPASGCSSAQAGLFDVSAREFLEIKALQREVFGPASLVVRCRDETELTRVLRSLEGQLTATIHATEADDALVARLLPILEGKAGRLVFNGWPTGVEVAHAMVHGGPYPATSDVRTTSVGTLAIDRFLRPVCYQNVPERLLPPALRDTAIATSPRRVDGRYES